METKEKILDKHWKFMQSKETGSFELKQCILMAMDEYGRIRYVKGVSVGKSIVCDKIKNLCDSELQL